MADDQAGAQEFGAVLYLTNLYALAIDTQQFHLFDEIFTDDVVVDFPEGRGWSGLETLKQAFDEMHAPYWATKHTITNHVWTMRGDTLKSVCYGHWLLIPSDPGGDRKEGHGWYEDIYVRTGDGWRIKHRTARRIEWAVVSGRNLRGTVPLREAASRGTLAFLES